MAQVNAGQKPFPPDRLFTKEEIGEMLAVPPRRVRRWWDDGKLGWVRLPGGRDRRSTGAQLNESLARNTSDQMER
jgi:hypothetical protein